MVNLASYTVLQRCDVIMRGEKAMRHLVHVQMIQIRLNVVSGSELRESRALSSLTIILDHVIAVADVVVVVAIFACGGQ